MANNNEFQAVRNQGQLQGFGNLLHKENSLWWRTSRWWVQTLIWIAIGNGILFMVIAVAPRMENSSGQTSTTQSTDSQQPLDILGLTVYLKIAGIATAIGVAVLAQDTLITEKQSGTAAWVLSKPVSRSALILSKVISNSAGIMISMVIVPGAIAYLIIFFIAGKAFPLLPYAGALGIFFVSLVFWLTLAIMLGSMSDKRGLAIGIPLFLIIGFILFVEIAPWTVNFMPWSLTNAVSAAQPAMAVALVLGQSVPTFMPLIGSLIGCIVFTLVAIWRFQKEEF
jgi:ABC-2 type transport system permease protein